MRLLHPSNSPLESWIRTATWYQLVRRFLTVAGPEYQADMEAPLAALHDALAAEAAELSTVYSAGTTAANKRVGYLVGVAWAEVEMMAEEALPAEEPSSMGKLGQTPVAWAAMTALQKVWHVAKWVGLIGGGMLGLWVFAKIAPTVSGGIKQLFESDAERAKREAETANAIWQSKLRALEECAKQCAEQGVSQQKCSAWCAENVDKSYDLITPTTSECGLLDTPTGTALGGIFGLLGGFVAAEAILGWVE